MSIVKTKKTLVKVGDIVRCFSGRNMFVSTITGIYVSNQRYYSIKKYWVEIPKDLDVEKLPGWRDVKKGSDVKFKQKLYAGCAFKADLYYIELDSAVAKRVTPIEMAVYNMKNEIFGKEPKKVSKKVAPPNPSSKKKAYHGMVADGEWHGTDNHGWTS